MRMAACPKCNKHNVNGYKKRGGWLSKCYNCGYTSEVPLESRKLSRYCWNINYENLTGETLPDEACGRQKGAFMKREKKIDLDKTIHCFTLEQAQKMFGEDVTRLMARDLMKLQEEKNE